VKPGTQSAVVPAEVEDQGNAPSRNLVTVFDHWGSAKQG
jgi:hypothetical protein